MGTLNKMPDSELQMLEQAFKRAMVAAYDIFGRKAFRKCYSLEETRYPINKALFECWSVVLSQLSDEQLDLLRCRKERVISQFVNMMNDRAFDDAISHSARGTAKIKRRFSAIKMLVDEVLS